ncbi:MAG TPA: alpha/beta fold hydrolase, partial [Rhodospirillaceae bacterium]|nr:alpha/beta fold hydrolase [Rhodospirillaceae bacterium]
GLRPFLVDWGAPGAGERGFGLDDYVAGRLSAILDVVLAAAGPPAVVGYCMGGLLALGLGVLRQEAVRGLGLLATPWDFHQPNSDQMRMVAAMRPAIEATLDGFGELPLDILQAMFATVDAGSIERKFRAFSHLPKAGAKARAFVAMEDWLNDGVPLTAAVARQTLFGWYVDNLPAKGDWRLAGRRIAAGDFTRPALALVPSKDRIVPPASAVALAEGLPACRLRMVDSGHIGMVTGARAGTEVYAVLARWLHRLAVA